MCFIESAFPNCLQHLFTKRIQEIKGKLRTSEYSKNSYHKQINTETSSGKPKEMFKVLREKPRSIAIIYIQNFHHFAKIHSVFQNFGTFHYTKKWFVHYACVNDQKLRMNGCSFEHCQHN